jgi:hypothetical protein
MNGSWDRANYVTAVASAIEIGPKATLRGMGVSYGTTAPALIASAPMAPARTRRRKPKAGIGDGAVGDEGLDAT